MIIFQIVELLLSNDSTNINLKDNQGATALHRAASKGITPIVSLLLSCNKNVNVNAVDNYGNAPL